MKTALKTALLASLSVAAIAFAATTLVAAKAPAIAVAQKPAPAASAASGTYAIDGVHSTVIFSTMHSGTSRSYGRFNTIGGTIVFDAAKPEASKVEIEIQTDSIDTANKGRDDHLRGPDFFDVKQFPVAKFVSSKVEKAGDKGWKVTGTLSIHGVDKQVTIPLEQTGAGKGRKGESLIGFHGAFTIDRFEYGIEYGKGALGDTVDLIVSIEAAAAK
jgi:polyisoprenoid-binding protein YceI